MASFNMFRSSAPQTECRRHYYSDEKLFEQSLDVWKPVDAPKSAEPLPLVVLVVGSAWLGHRSIVYTGTSWWNSSGPRTFARLGCVCVCIRHRGAFPVLPELHVLCALLVAIASSVYYQWGEHVALIAAGVFVVMVALWALGVRGSAKFEDMLHDVSDALVWVNDNKEKHLAPVHGGTLSSTPFVFGGYSSGGHVAATLLQRPKILESRGLPSPDDLCDAVLLVSGVLAVRPNSKGEPDERAPRWFTDLVTQMVFGKTAALSIPSPLYQTVSGPRLPHVLIGCENEVFGINWMDIFFCSKQFAASLEAIGIPARYVEIQSDHWNILNSSALSHALEDELRWICKAHSTVSAVCEICKKRYCVGGHAVASAAPRPEDIRQE